MTTIYTPPNAPFAKDSDTSAAAARDLNQRRRETIYRLIVNYVRRQLILGATREEIELALAIKGDTVRPRVKEALAKGDLKLSTSVRKTKAGRMSEVLICTLARPL